MKWVLEVGWMGGAYLGRLLYCPWDGLSGQ